MRALLINRFLGVLFVGLLVGGVFLVAAIFNQDFTPFDKVTLHTDKAGLQLPDQADVKVRGMEVGELLQATPYEHGAVLTLGIDPSKIGQIPANVSAAILPKTLFGEKYVELDFPQGQASPQHLQAGSHITQTKMPIEVERVLSDIYPLLRTIQPAELDYTLSAIADALEGRGQEIGHTIVALDQYLKRLNPQVPALVRDLHALANVSGAYADIVPEVARILRHTVKTGNTLVAKQAQLHQFLRSTSAFSKTTRNFLNTNGDNIIQLGRVTQPTAALLREYSPEYPCLFQGMARQLPLLNSAFRHFTLHIDLELLPKQPRGYGPQDSPVVADHHGPSCVGLPNPPGSQANPIGSKTSPIRFPNFRDGVDDNGGSLGRGDNQRAALGFDRTASAPQIAAGTSDEQALIRSLIGPELGVPANQVGDMSTLMVGPALAGTKVSAR